MDEKKRILVDTTIGHFIEDGLIFLPSYLVLFFDQLYKFSYFQNGIILAMYYIGNGLISPFTGRLIDKTKRKGLLMGLGLLALDLAFMLLIIPFPHNFALLGISTVMFFVGVFSTIYHPVGSMLLNYYYKEKSGLAMGINGMGGSIGRAIFPLLIAILAGLTGAKTYGIFILTFIILFPLIFISFDLRKSIVYVHNENKGKIFRYSLPVLVLFAVSVLRSISISGGNAMLPSYLDLTLNYNQTLIAILLVIGYSSAIFGQPFFGYLSDKIGRRIMISLTSIFFGISVIILMFQTSLISVSLGLIFTYFFGFSGFPLLMSIIGDIADESQLAEISAIVWGVAGSIGGAFGTFLIGYLTNVIGATNSFLFIGILSIVSAFPVFLIPTKRRSR